MNLLPSVLKTLSPSAMGEICRTFTNFKTGETGLTLPREREVTFDGKPPAGPALGAQTVALNEPVEAGLFPKPN